MKEIRAAFNGVIDEAARFVEKIQLLGALMFKHRAASPGAGSVLGDVLRDGKQLIARFELGATLSDCGCKG